MGLESGRVTTSSQISTNMTELLTSPNYGVVYEVLLDVGTQTAKNKGITTSAAIGAIRFRSMGGTSVNYDSQLPLAYPIDKNSTSLPTKNEIVVIHNFGGNYHYSRIGGDISPNVNTVPNLISSKFLANDRDNTFSNNKSKNYQNVSQTGIARKNSSTTNNDYDGFGEYFESQQNVHKLKLYEGDTLVESRFGQSIRFSAYNNLNGEKDISGKPTPAFSPTIIIRNGENAESLKNEIGKSTEEDINKDGGIICLSSGERLLNYTLPVQNTKESFFNYPNELKGNQILLNSDRLIFSARTSEMIFASKKDAGFITDGQFSIDASRGINITTNDNIFVDTKDRDFNIDIGSGTIALGTDEGELEAAVKGETLKQILYDFMTIVAQQIFVTPAGPSSPGPTNNPKINALVQRLDSMLSNNVQLK